jgi:hypothetical protein
MWFQPWHWFRRAAPSPPSSFPIVLYTRQGCHLCAEALDLLRQYEKPYGLTIHIIDIDQDPGLVSAYGDKVPVIALEGRPRLWGKPNAVLLRRILQTRAS